MVRWIGLFSVLFLIYSCSKESSDTFQYAIQGIKDVSSNIGETITFDLSLVNESSVKEEVFLELQGLPKGVTYKFTTSKGTPDFNTTLVLNVTADASLGNYPLTIVGTSATFLKVLPLTLVVDDKLSLSVSVYDATKWTPEQPWGALTDSVSVKLFKNEQDFYNKKDTFSAYTNAEGKALFYRVPAGEYLIVVEKGKLSNISKKVMVNNTFIGFVTAGIFVTKNEVYNSSQPTAQPGDLKYRDQNADGKITDADRVAFDQVSIYEGTLNQKIIWIGN